jgi:hypothetical protein
VKIEAITTCVGSNARKMLEFTAPQNIKFFDKFVVVTSTEDLKTQDFCEKNKLNCIITKSFNKYGFSFNKGAGINEGIKFASYDAWIYHIDNDIYCPNNYREILEKELDDIECFYGSPRSIVEKQSDFDKLISGEIKEKDLVSYPGIYGFSSIWHQQSEIIKNGAIYPENCEKGESDWRWRNLWGDHAEKDEVCLGKLKRLSVKVWHLGLPDIAGSDNFWK